METQTIKQENVDCFATKSDANFDIHILDSMEKEPVKLEPHSYLPEPNNLVQKCNLTDEPKLISNDDKCSFNCLLNEISKQNISEMKHEESKEMEEIAKLEDICMVDVKWSNESEEVIIKDDINVEGPPELRLNEISKQNISEMKHEESEEMEEIAKLEDICMVDVKRSCESEEVIIKDDINVEDPELRLNEISKQNISEMKHEESEEIAKLEDICMVDVKRSNESEEVIIKDDINVEDPELREASTLVFRLPERNSRAATMSFTVEYLKNNFSSLNLEQKIQIKNFGRPKPELNLTQTTKGKNRDYVRKFKTDIYEKNDWICGCETTNRLFCFPCLLFGRAVAEPAWIKNGVIDLGHLSEKIQKHENNQSHINAQLELRLLGKVDIRRQLDSAYRQCIQQHNDRVRKNRYVLMKIIDCIKFCGAFELALRGHNEKDNSANSDIFKGLINFSAELDIALKDHFEKSTVFKGTSKIIQNELLDCMLQVAQENIKKEISKADYVAVIADETTDVANCYQMTTVFRYILPDGTPVERFWNLVSPPDHDALSLAQCIKTNLEQVLDKRDKLISQSYDGASVMSGRHAGVQTLIKIDYKYAFFIHCYAHQLNLILSQATSQNQEVRVFFSNLSDISNFFSNFPQRVAVLDEIVGQRVPRSSVTTWNFKSRVVSTVYEYREVLIECMEKIEATSKQTITINQASGIYRMLSDSKFVFWLTVFHRILPHADILYNQLQKTVTDPVQLHKAIKYFENCIQKERDNMDSIQNEISEHTTKRRKGDPHISRNVAAKKVCNTVIIQVKERFSFTKHLNADILFFSNKFSLFDKKFPSEHLESIVEAYPFLNKVRLKTELELIYRRADFRTLSGAINLLKFLIDNNLQNIFSATFNLLQIVITIPMTTAEAERNFSTLKRIKTFLRSSMNQERLSALAMLSIEKAFIDNIVSFNDEVINIFSTNKKRRMDFIYKDCTQ